MDLMNKPSDAKIRDLEPREKMYFVSFPGSNLKLRTAVEKSATVAAG